MKVAVAAAKLTATRTNTAVVVANIPRWQRLLIAATVATVLVPFTFRGVGDFGQPWFAASAILHGADPFRLIGLNGPYVYQHELPLIYPLTASVAILPLGLLREAQAAVVFSWISSFLFVYAITANGWERLPILLSLPFLSAAHQPQWSLLLGAGFCLPAVAWTFAAKPTLGAALLVSTGSMRTFTIAVVGGAGLLLVSLLVVPSWPAEWLRNLGETQMTAPIQRPGGFLAAAALLRWRRPEARLIAALACVPQTNAWYDVAILLLVASTFRESLFLTVPTTALMLYEMTVGSKDGILDFYPPYDFVLIAAAYVPATIIVLRRPNEGSLPAWFELLRRLGRRRAAPAATA